MSVAEITAVLHKEAGNACGFTLVRNSCTINRIVDPVSIDEQLRPGDLILRINDTEVSDETVRDVLRTCRDLTEVCVTVSRTAFHSKRFQDQARMLGILSPTHEKKEGGCFPNLFSCSKKKPTGKENVRRQSSSAGSYDPPAGRRLSSSIGSYSPQGFGSVTSVSSTGMRTLDLRKLQKETGGTMWKASRESSTLN